MLFVLMKKRKAHIIQLTLSILERASVCLGLFDPQPLWDVVIEGGALHWMLHVGTGWFSGTWLHVVALSGWGALPMFGGLEPWDLFLARTRVASL